MVDLPCRARPGKLTDASVGWSARDEVVISDIAISKGRCVPAHEVPMVSTPIT